ncbi:hypothetical protein APHWI1_0115 [Anaplasma phagocytophilum str. ApWI1]|uniref:Uncharacterized protein n=3 Tax=Anaplasma phagocytophilum TaxID=948 RepID=Q2GK84_ANAPZ|nr:hypothetical protein APH_0630 [Anaplasma phagocytophilum str. HZ]KJV60717.1 hypothetical protein APHWEB_1396 [Anaplasma phagocytophilum str. Webster]KJV65291.1 hypothetical protein EPHNCH_0924 [Anaplasma phagocytophilum str. NCH-1]KJV82472.1 hypothetical protein APHHGE2_0913 [Anaplasma phagocytophilum str. HGE2]KJV84357.1 hypothetical protein APHWI1_0115 [Anaplasma phagocytophilum str. ApWI1]KJV86557.1 hypothetical protein APHNYW_1364 [Anaplasma phagocytophilum str. ApNYW]KJV98629.1 hypoth
MHFVEGFFVIDNGMRNSKSLSEENGVLVLYILIIDLHM